MGWKTVGASFIDLDSVVSMEESKLIWKTVIAIVLIVIGHVVNSFNPRREQICTPSSKM